MDSIESNSNVARHILHIARISFKLNFMKKKNILRLSEGPLASDITTCISVCVCEHLYIRICAHVYSHVRQSAQHHNITQTKRNVRILTAYN